MIREQRALIWIIAGAFLLRLVLLVLRGDYLVFDEGYYLLLARNLRNSGEFSLNGLPHVALSPLQPVLVALLSLSGLPDLWVSRLLAALCGALLAIPVWSLARRIGGERCGLPAALLVVLAPSMMSFLPFFPGQGWNLYFGSEPLFLLLAFTSCAAAARAAATSETRAFALAGVSAGAAFLTRAEGVILAPLILGLLGFMVWRTRGSWPRWMLAVLLAAVVSAPYLLYLRSTLGRWAFSGRVQAAALGASAAPSTRATAQRGGSVLEGFVWGGDQARFQVELYGLTPDGRRMQSQYWGVDSTSAGPLLPALPEPGSPPAPQGDDPSFAGMMWRAIAVVVPVWLLLAGIAGIALKVRVRETAWLIPPLVAALLPAFVAYVEPRSLLPLLPLSTIGAALAWSAMRRYSAAVLAIAAVVLVFPVLRDAVRSRNFDTPLQDLAAAQRAVGTLLGRHLDSGPIMSWHPAIAIYADRDWRVMPLAPVERVIPYARRRARAVVFSRFHPSPLTDTPRPFTALILPGDSVVVSSPLALQQVDVTALTFVGHMAPAQ